MTQQVPAGFVPAPDVLTAQEQYDTMSWQVGDAPKLFIPVVSVAPQIGNRIIKHRRPYREGAKLDDTGGEPRQWTIVCVFNNTIIEQGIDDNGRPLFPDVYRALKDSFDQHFTGDLVIPGEGAVRARAETMSAIETFEDVDHVVATVIFVQDNEEALDRALIRPPTARATTRRLAETTVFTAQSLGAWDGDLNGLVEFAAGVEDLLLAPGRAQNAVETQVRRNRRAIERITDAQQQLAEDVGLETNRPRGSSMERQSLLLRDRQAAAAGERSQGRPRVTTFVVDVEVTSIFEIAARVDQSAEELLDLNDSRIGDPFELRRGDPVLVYQTRGV